MERVKKRFWLSVGAMGVILIFLLVFGAFYISLMLDKQNAQTAKYLEDVALQSKNTVVKQVEGDFQTLEALSIMIGRQPETDAETLLNTLKAINDDNAFIRMGYVDTQGLGYITDISGKNYYAVDFHDRLYVQKALNGEAYVSDALEDRLGGDWGNCYGVPIYRDGQVVGALCAVNNISTLCDSMNGFLNDNSGFIYIVTGAGDLVMPSTHPDAEPNLYNLFELKFTNEAERERVRQELAAGETGFFSFLSASNAAYWASYVKVGIKDWYAVSVMPKAQVNGGFVQVVRWSIIAFIFLVLLFVVLLFYNYRMMQSNRASIARLAYYDSLTGAYNKNKFVQEAGELLRQKNRRYMLAALDIRNFSFINEVYGFDKGDQLLRHMKQVLEKQVKENEAFFRSEADRFCALLIYESDERAVERITQILAAIDDYSLDRSQKNSVVCLCGIKVIASAEHGEGLELRLDRAFMALDKAKETGMNCVFFDDELYAQVSRRKYIENHMSEALETGEFQVFYQPKISLEDRGIMGAEALIRWKIGDGTLVPPDEFIPIFEQNGFIVRLDVYVLDQVCRRLRGWLDQGRPVLPVSVNQSRRLLFQESYIRTLFETVEKYGLSPRMIILEITESIAMEEAEILKNLLAELHRLGFRVSMDDFGSGYSSLNVLKDIRVDELKLDREFLLPAQDGERRDTIVRNIIHLAQDLGIATVAEGVETEGQAKFLQECGCDIAQGYYFARPMPPDKMEELLQTSKTEQNKQYCTQS